MKIAINEQYGGVDVIKIAEAEKPNISTKEVLVAVEAAGLNPKDILVRKGKFKRLSGRKFPQGIGYDFAGRISDPNGSDFSKGEQVFGMLNGMIGRSCAEYVNIDKSEFYKMPEDISFEEAAGIPLAGQTSLQAIRNLGRLQKGQRILINGASGGVGTLAIQIAKALGGEVTTISSTKNMAFCKELGADHALSYEESNILTHEQQFDVFYDVFGNYSFKKIAPILTPAGRYITTVPKPDIFIEQIWNLFRKKKAKIVVVKSNRKDLTWLHEQIAAKQIKPVTDKVFPLEEIKAAQSYIETKRAKGKVILQVS